VEKRLRTLRRPSDAWDHAIKAVEAILLPTILPKQDQAKIGQVLGELASNGGKWDVGLLFNQSGTPRTPPTAPAEAPLGMLRLIYPNPTGTPARTTGPRRVGSTSDLRQSRVVPLRGRRVRLGRRARDQRAIGPTGNPALRRPVGSRW
jgi:hypothetical protein